MYIATPLHLKLTEVLAIYKRSKTISIYACKCHFVRILFLFVTSIRPSVFVQQRETTKKSPSYREGRTRIRTLGNGQL